MGKAKTANKTERAARRQTETILASAETIPEVLIRIQRVCQRVSDNDWIHQKVLKSVMTDLAKADLKRSPAEIMFEALGTALKILGSQDPFAKEKDEYNQRLLAMLPDLEKKVRQADSPLQAACRLAVAGNIIDPPSVPAFDIAAELREALTRPPAIEDFVPLREAVSTADRILYLLGNAGEVVLDRLLLAELEKLGKPITAVVRKNPVLFAATEADAAAAELDEFADIINPGGDMLGIVGSNTSAQFREAFRVADVVIAKDRTHYEVLYGSDREIFFLFRVKDPLVARRLSVDTGDGVLLRYRPETSKA